MSKQMSKTVVTDDTQMRYL